MSMEKLGIGLAATAFAILSVLLVLAVIRGTVAWPLALASPIALGGLILAAKSVRGIQRWTRSILFLMLLLILTAELLFNPRCWVVLDPSQHGCHSAMIAIVLGAVGVALSRIRD
jgi:hypothetical protein